MVKLYCDRCEKEIKDRYYTINIYSHDVNPKYDYDTAVVSTSAYSNGRDDILRTLNSTRMYCKECRDKIEEFNYTVSKK